MAYESLTVQPTEQDLPEISSGEGNNGKINDPLLLRVLKAKSSNGDVAGLEITYNAVKGAVDAAHSQLSAATKSAASLRGYNDSDYKSKVDQAHSNLANASTRLASLTNLEDLFHSFSGVAFLVEEAFLGLDQVSVGLEKDTKKYRGFNGQIRNVLDQLSSQIPSAGRRIPVSALNWLHNEVSPNSDLPAPIGNAGLGPTAYSHKSPPPPTADDAVPQPLDGGSRPTPPPPTAGDAVSQPPDLGNLPPPPSGPTT